MNNKVKRVQAMLDEETFAKLVAAAKESRVTVSNYVRILIEKDVN